MKVYIHSIDTLLPEFGYDQMFASLKEETFESQYDKGIVWAGTPDEIAKLVEAYDAKVGGFDTASLQVNFHDMPIDAVKSSMRLFSQKVMPQVRG